MRYHTEAIGNRAIIALFSGLAAKAFPQPYPKLTAMMIDELLAGQCCDSLVHVMIPCRVTKAWPRLTTDRSTNPLLATQYPL